MTVAVLLGSEEPVVHLTTQARVIAVLLALGFLLVVLEFIRSHRLQERHSVIWFLLALGMLVGAAFPQSLELLARAIGVRDTNVALFSLILLVLLGLCFYFTVLLSRQSEQITRLAQETAIARAERDEA
ncbi:MAG: DUF2304 domain-containing protein, partial [Solirubrobacterales bacterium]|nr:DUF2304 domain-containing protein [Solirubrobacterales bacterium]